jgi:hypothetical protein
MSSPLLTAPEFCGLAGKGKNEMGKLAGITNRQPAPNYMMATYRPLLIPVTPGATRQGRDRPQRQLADCPRSSRRDRVPGHSITVSHNRER